MSRVKKRLIAPKILRHLFSVGHRCAQTTQEIVMSRTIFSVALVILAALSGCGSIQHSVTRTENQDGTTTTEKSEFKLTPIPVTYYGSIPIYYDGYRGLYYHPYNGVRIYEGHRHFAPPVIIVHEWRRQRACTYRECGPRR